MFSTRERSVDVWIPHDSTGVFFPGVLYSKKHTCQPKWIPASVGIYHQPYGHMMPYGLWQCHFMANLHNLSALHRESGWCHAMADDTDEAMVMYQ